MSEIISINGGVSGFHWLYACTSMGSAQSCGAKLVRDAALVVTKAVERSQALFGGKANAIAHLSELKAECGEAGWDCHDAAPVDLLAIRVAQAFVRALPDRLPLPEMAVDPDGSISLDWMNSPNRLLSLSINAGSRIAFAWLDGGDSGNGVESFDGQTVPPRILESIFLTMDKTGRAPVWAA